MPVTFSDDEAKKLEEEVNSLLAQLRSMVQLQNNCKSDMKEFYNTLRLRAVFSDMADRCLRGRYTDAYKDSSFNKLLGKMLLAYKLEPVGTECGHLLSDEKIIQQDIEKIRACTGFFHRLFIGREKKAESEAAYQRLLQRKNGEFAQQIHAVENMADEAKNAAQQVNAEEYFKYNKVQFTRDYTG